MANYATIYYAPNFNDEQNPTISYTNTNVVNTSSVQACIMVPSGSSVTTVALYRDIPNSPRNDYTFPLSAPERTALRKAASTVEGGRIEVIFRIRSVVSGTPYTHDAIAFMEVINATPTISFSITDTNSFTSNLVGDPPEGNPLPAIILGYSTLKVGVTGIPYKECTIRRIWVGNGSDPNSGIELPVTSHSEIEFPNVLSDVVRITIEDSCGRKNSLVTKVDTVPYTPLTCNIEVASITYPTDATATTNFTISGVYYNKSFGKNYNTLQMSVRTKKGSSSWSSWSSVSPTKTTEDYTLNYPVTADYQSAVEIEVNVSDSLGSIIKSYKSQTTPVFDWGEDDFAFNVPVSVHGALNVDDSIEAYSIKATSNITTDSALNVKGMATFDSAVLVQGYTPLCVVSSGTSGNWTYSKYSDGTAECWAVVNKGVDIATAWGSIFVSTNQTGLAFPFAFTSTPMCIISLNGGYQGAWIVRSGSSATPTSTTNTGSYQIARGTSYPGGTYYVTFYARGKWK